MPSEIFPPSILEYDSLTDEYKLETKENCTVYFDNTTVCINKSGDIDIPQKLVKGIYNDNDITTLDFEDKTVITAECTGSYDSTNNSSFTDLEDYELNDDNTVYN